MKILVIGGAGIQEKLLGHAPRGFENFAAETAGAWRA
jgi:hypothetical protein